MRKTVGLSHERSGRSVPMALGKHLFSFRTQKLSPVAASILRKREISTVPNYKEPLRIGGVFSWIKLFNAFKIFQKSLKIKKFSLYLLLTVKSSKLPTLTYLVPPTLGTGPGLPIFVIRVHRCIHHISLVRIRNTFAIVPTPFDSCSVYSWNVS